jgi:hypothetical protein
VAAMAGPMIPGVVVGPGREVHVVPASSRRGGRLDRHANGPTPWVRDGAGRDGTKGVTQVRRTVAISGSVLRGSSPADSEA